MKIVYNGTEIGTTASTVEELFKLQDINVHSAVILYNGQSIPNEICASILLKENDSIDIIKYIVGG